MSRLRRPASAAEAALVAAAVPSDAQRCQHGRFLSGNTRPLWPYCQAPACHHRLKEHAEAWPVSWECARAPAVCRRVPNRAHGARRNANRRTRFCVSRRARHAHTLSTHGSMSAAQSCKIVTLIGEGAWRVTCREAFVERFKSQIAGRARPQKSKRIRAHAPPGTFRATTRATGAAPRRAHAIVRAVIAFLSGHTLHVPV